MLVEFNENIVREPRICYFHTDSIDFRWVTSFYR